MNRLLRTGCERLSLNLSEQQLSRLEQYMAAVLRFNQSYNLMKADDEDALAVNHLLDSLAGAPHVQKIASATPCASIADVGSGGGCPGIPLAVAMPGCQFTLVERMEKRCAFLEDVASSLSLGNVRVLCKNAAEVTPGSFDVAVFRAFHPFDKKIVGMLFALLRPGASLVAYKARAERIKQEMQAVSTLIPSYTKVPLAVPYLEDHERNLVIIRKPCGV